MHFPNFTVNHGWSSGLQPFSPPYPSSELPVACTLIRLRLNAVKWSYLPMSSSNPETETLLRGVENSSEWTVRWPQAYEDPTNQYQ